MAFKQTASMCFVAVIVAVGFLYVYKSIPAVSSDEYHGHAQNVSVAESHINEMKVSSARDDAAPTRGRDAAPVTDYLSDQRLTESALAVDDDHYALPRSMNRDNAQNVDAQKSSIEQFLNQADAEELRLQKQIDLAVLKELPKSDVARLQADLDQLRKNREALILKNISILDKGFFHD